MARAFTMGVLAVSVVMATTSLVVSVSMQNRIEPGTIVVVGDPDAPGMARAIAELERDVAHGDRLMETGDPIPWGVVVVLLALAWIGVGVLIVWRQPSHWAGWIFLITGATVPVITLAQAVVIYDLKAGGSPPFGGLFAWVGEYALNSLALLPLLFLLYPDGHPPSPRWRWVVAGLLGGTALSFLGFVLRPEPYNAFRGDGIVYENPFGIEALTWAGGVIAVGTMVVLASTLATVVAVVQRFRRSSGEERQQMRVLALVAALFGVGFAMLLALIVIGTALGLDEREDSGDWIFGLAFALTGFTILIGVPAAYLVAIFRYRLWELDVVVKKTAVAVVLTLLLGGFGLLVIGILGQSALWGGNSLGVFIGVIAGALVIPLFRLSRRVARRVVFGRRATPYDILTAFGERVGETYSTEDVLPRMAQLLARGTGADSARVLLRVGAELREEARWPEDADVPDEERTIPVVDRGEELGALAVSMPASDPMNPGKEKLIRDLAAQAGLVLRNVKLIEELRASRQRLVAAQDEERRKIERNIHDGAQQQLVALTVKLRLAQGLVEKDAAKAESMLADLQAETQGALEDLRDLARGIYPPLLADQGLSTALQAQARKAAVPTAVETDGIGRYHQDVESAIYFCALEALNNVAKYAQASHATIELEQRDGHLTFEVRDDGDGFDVGARRHGTGLQGMADRLEAIGGTLEVRSSPGSGTSVMGRVPVGSKATL
jgi:signal transduction histidine kinase